MPPLVEHLPAATARENLMEYFHRNLQGYRCISIRIAAARDKAGAWQSALWSIRGVADDDPDPDERDFAYPAFRLREVKLEAERFRRLFDELLDQGRLLDVASKVSDISGSSVTRHILPARSQFAERPGVAWVFSGAGRPDIPWGPLAEFGLPYHSSANDAMAQWIHIRDWHGGADGRIGGGLIFLPETRATFRSFEIVTPTKLDVKLRRARWFETDVRLKGVVRDGKNARTIDEIVAGDSARIPLLEDANELELAVVADGGHFLDWHHETPDAVQGLGRALTGGPEIDAETKELHELVDGGEGDRVEFKPFVMPGEKPKWTEVFETVCAFANTQGGTLLIGVDDHGVVRGVESDARVWAKGKHAPDQVSMAYARELRRQIGNVLAPAPSTSVRVVRLAEHDVVVLEVATSTEKPHELIESREVLVRRGATDRRVSVEEFTRLVNPGSAPARRRR